MAKINRKNSKGQEHGFWDLNNPKRHYVNGFLAGSYEGCTYKYNFKNDNANGVQLCPFIQFGEHFSEQVFMKQQKKFGEKLIWKKLR